MKQYTVTYVHPIAGQCPDATIRASIRDGAFADRKTLGAELRARGVMHSGTHIREMRVVGDRVVVFPSRCPGGWHSISLTCDGEA